MRLSINKNVITIELLTAFVLLVLVLLGKNVLFCMAIFVWISLIIYSFSDLYNRSLLLAFLIAFFLFLMGRDFLEVFLNYNFENFPESVNNHAYLVYIISLFSIGISFPLFNKNSSQMKNEKSIKHINRQNNYGLASKIVFYLVIGFAIVSKLIVAKYVSDTNYYEYYVGYYAYSSNNTIAKWCGYFERIMPVALCGYLASMPSKSEVKVPLTSYAVYLFVSLASGARSTTMLGALFIAVYFIFRQKNNPREEWITKSTIFGFILISIGLVIVASFISLIRDGEGLAGFNPILSILDFFYDQGVTSNVIKRAYMYKDLIPREVLYTFEFLRSGFFAKVLGIKTYYGNSLDHALYGGSFAHIMGYLVLGNSYLAGHGTGSSFLAEFYQDYGYFGVVIGSCLYSYLCAQMTILNKENSKFIIKTLQLYLIQRILWAPRGSFADIINSVFSIQVFAFFVATFLLQFLIRSWRKVKKGRIIDGKYQILYRN